MLNVVAYTGGLRVPSARFRVRQYVPRLKSLGVDVAEVYARLGKYPPAASWQRIPWAMARLGEACIGAVGSRGYDAILFQRELLSTFLTVEPLYGRPRVLDVDDAIWLHRRGSFALRFAKRCDLILCGNAYLADYFSRSGREVRILPTGVDTDRFVPGQRLALDAQVIGWSGSGGNLRFLEAIERPLSVVLERFPEACIRVVCDRAPSFATIPPERVDFVPWTPDGEVAALQDLSIGLMPLPDEAWSRGKCAFKMLTYMACGIPVVVSPVGANAALLKQGDVGYGPTTDDEWVDAITYLLNNPEQNTEMGETGRALADINYSTRALAPELANYLKYVVGQSSTE